MNLCRDCRYYGAHVNQAAVTRFADIASPFIPPPGSGLMCMHPATVSEVSPVTGKEVRKGVAAFAFHQRRYPKLLAVLFGKCGAAARWFEPKEAA